jgi:SnoaL-like domain
VFQVVRDTAVAAVDPLDLTRWATLRRGVGGEPRLAPDFELHGRPDVPDAKVYRGREETKEFWRMLQEVWAELRWEPLEFTDLGDAVVVETRIVALGRGSDLRIEAVESSDA